MGVYREISTPLGPMIAAALEGDLVLLEFADRRMLRTQFARLERRFGCAFTRGDAPVLRRVERQLAEYFAGERRDFDLPIRMAGTPFQREAWKALRRIPAGARRSYAEQAAAIGRPQAVRAVARANGDNPIAIVVPCHRVVGSDGSLTGYGGGLWRKRRPLEIEAAAADAVPAQEAGSGPASTRISRQRS